MRRGTAFLLLTLRKLHLRKPQTRFSSDVHSLQLLSYSANEWNIERNCISICPRARRNSITIHAMHLSPNNTKFTSNNLKRNCFIYNKRIIIICSYIYLCFCIWWWCSYKNPFCSTEDFCFSFTLSLLKCPPNSTISFHSWKMWKINKRKLLYHMQHFYLFCCLFARFSFALPFRNVFHACFLPYFLYFFIFWHLIKLVSFMLLLCVLLHDVNLLL